MIAQKICTRIAFSRGSDPLSLFVEDPIVDLQHRCDVIRAARSDRMVKRSSLHRRETTELSSKKLKIITRGDHALIARRAEGRTCLRIDG